MKFTSFLHKKLVDLLNDRRIVVWYDADGAFKGFVRAFKAPNCVVLSAEESVLKTRRRADEIYRLMNESEDPGERDRCLLIYIPGRRGVTEDERVRDPFEVYAMAGTAFGDTEDQKAESLARQAMPDLNDGVIINAAPLHRLFRLRSWAKETEEVWRKLEKGDYDWAHMAYTIWPDRVREVCRRDRSIAIAHGLEAICEVEAPAPKKKGGRGRRKRGTAG